MKRNSSASVVLYTLMILAAIVFLTQQLMRGVFVGSHFVKSMIDRERAEMLALGGINIAIAQLTFDEEEAKAKQKKAAEANKIQSEEDKKDPLIQHLQQVLPYVNRWRDFKLTEKADGIDGLIRVCITCESGKININQAFDFAKMEFKKPYEELLKGLEVRGKMPMGEMLTRLTELFKKRKRKLDDISELLEIQGLRTLDIFYRPPSKAAKGKKSQPNTELALQDIFTTWSPDDKIDLLWMSDALCAIFGLRRPIADDPEVRKDRYKLFFENFKKDMAQDWDANWKVLEHIYDQKPKILQSFKEIFTKVFGPKVFSVLSCGKVGPVEQYVLAVIREDVRQQEQGPSNKEQQQDGKKSNEPKKPKKMFTILRVYWL